MARAPAVKTETLRAPTKGPPPGVSAAELASLFKCTTRLIHSLVNEGIVVRVAPGRYAPSQSTSNYIVHLRERAAAHKSEDGKLDAVAANAELKQSQKALYDLKIAEMNGRLISMPEIEAVWTDLVIEARQLFLSLPTRIRSKLPGLTEADAKVIHQIVTDALNDAALSKEKPPGRRNKK